MPRTARFTVLLSLCATPLWACAQIDGLSISTGVKAMRASWQTASYSASGALGPTYTSDQSATALSPFVSLRLRDFVFNASLLPSTSYRFRGTAVSKTESDVSVGYATGGTYWLLGYKQVKQDWGGFKQDNAGPYVGLQGSGRLVGGLGAYGSMAYSPAFSTKYSNGRTADGTYYTVEAGLAYSFGPLIPATKGLTATLGLRRQVIDTDNFNDVFAGVTAGVGVTF